MSEFDNTQGRKLSQIIPFILLLLLIPVSIIAFNLVRNLISEASPEKQPKEVRLTDVTEASFVVSWITDTATVGQIVYSKTADLASPVAAKDSRDGTSTTPRDTHYVRLLNLDPSTTYYFQIMSDTEKYGDSDGIFTIDTAAAPSSPGVPVPMKGLVTNGANQSAIVYLTMEDVGVKSFPVSTYTNNTGAWSADLAATRTADLSGIFTP